MSWSEAFLGIIALATFVMALIQIGVIVVAARIARQVQETLVTVQQDIRPLIANATAVAEEASQTVAIATAQAQKLDRLVSDLSGRLEYTASVVQDAIMRPAREGFAVLAAIRAGLGVLRGLRDLRPRNGRTVDEEDPLFIG